MKNIFKKISIDYILKNYFYLIVLLLIPLILIIGLLYLIAPTYASMKIELQTAIDLENKYTDLKISHIKNLKNYKENFNKIDNLSIEKIKKILPYNPDASVIIDEVNQISKIVGVNIEKISFNNLEEEQIEEKEKNNVIKKINFSIDIVNGKDYETFKKLISKLESDIRVFDVNNFYITDDFNRYTLNIDCYYKKTQ